MGLLGWTGLPGKYVDVGGLHQVRTARGVETLCCCSAGNDARFRNPDDPEDYRVVIVPREQWASRILDLRTASTA